MLRQLIGGASCVVLGAPAIPTLMHVVAVGTTVNPSPHLQITRKRLGIPP